MYNKHMNSKIIKKIMDYAKQQEIVDLTIVPKDGYHLLTGENGLSKHQLKLPAKLAGDLSLVYKQLLKIAPDDLVSSTYLKDQDTTFKISIVPELNGEKIIINTITKNRKLFSLSKLGLGREERKIVENFLKKNKGLIVIGADDNEGKTSTLYALLQKINKEVRACYLLEKYNELELPEISKITSSQEKRLLDLQRVLKSDSDVIAIDDADDDLLKEALVAAYSGRLALATCKTTSAANLVDKIQKISRREDLPILLIYQRMFKKNCPHCLKAYLANESTELINNYWPSNKKYRPQKFFSSLGCPKCQHSGNSGEIASFNLIEINKQSVNIISSLASDILQKAANGLISMSKFISESKTEENKKL